MSSERIGWGGPGINRKQLGLIGSGETQGADITVDGRGYVVPGHEDGFFVGPTVIGLMSDHVFTTPAGVRYSLAVVVGVSAPLMCALMLLASGPYKRLREMAH